MQIRLFVCLLKTDPHFKKAHQVNQQLCVFMRGWGNGDGAWFFFDWVNAG